MASAPIFIAGSAQAAGVAQAAAATAAAAAAAVSTATARLEHIPMPALAAFPVASAAQGTMGITRDPPATAVLAAAAAAAPVTTPDLWSLVRSAWVAAAAAAASAAEAGTGRVCPGWPCGDSLWRRRRRRRLVRQRQRVRPSPGDRRPNWEWRGAHQGISGSAGSSRAGYCRPRFDWPRRARGASATAEGVNAA